MKKLASAFIGFVSLFCYPNVWADQFPVTVTDDRGKAVTIDKQPVSIVSIATFGADLMTAFGLEVSGVSSMGNRKPDFLGSALDKAKDLGSAHETNLELLTQIKPDLVVAIRQYTEMHENKYEAIGKFVAYDFITYEQSRHAIASVSAAVGKKQQGEALNAEYEKLLNDFNKRAPGGVSAVFIWHWADILWAHYDHYMTGSIMQSLKIKNAVGPSPTPEMINPHAKVLTMEELLALNPDFIFSFQAGEQPIQAHPVWSRLKAVKNGHAYRVGNQYAEVHGPIAREMVLREMANLVYPSVFSKATNIPLAAQARSSEFKNK